jgi:chromosomal replication initiation ATPase DnaA
MSNDASDDISPVQWLFEKYIEKLTIGPEDLQIALDREKKQFKDAKAARKLRYALSKERALVNELEVEALGLRKKVNNRKSKENSKVIEDFFVKCKVDKVNPKFKIDLDEILADECAVPIQAIRLASRKRDIVFARQIGCYILWKYYPIRYSILSLNNIAAHFGYVDHTTVLHAVRNIEDTLSLHRSSEAATIRRIIDKVKLLVEETPVIA